MNKCIDTEIQDMLPDLLHGSLNEDARRQVEAHVASCESCQGDLDVIRTVKSAAVFARAIDVDGVVRQIPPYRMIVPGLEHPTRTTITVDVRKRWALSWPRLENDTFIMSIGSARPMEDAARIAYADLVKWLVADYGFDKWDAYLVLTQIGRARLGNMVDPNYTIGAGIAKTYLPE